jgi:hypothetical protein
MISENPRRQALHKDQSNCSSGAAFQLFLLEKDMKKRIISFILVIVLIIGAAPAALAASADASAAAEALYELGLFRGTSAGFELDRTPTRQEAIVMLIRLLGEEDDALGGSWAHPFTDVDVWAGEYVGYAYEKGYTKGISDDDVKGHIFGGGSTEATAVQYLTFVLRALEYRKTREISPPETRGNWPIPSV